MADKSNIDSETERQDGQLRSPNPKTLICLATNDDFDQLRPLSAELHASSTSRELIADPYLGKKGNHHGEYRK